jgi:oxygen-independent coproporphyrinogen-3 oxidase
VPQVALDLIFAAPGETRDGWAADLGAAIAVGPDHVSTYGLTYEKGTSFWRRLRTGALRPAEEETEREMYLAAIHRLSAAGYEHYEVSNFALPGRRCRHNERYWLGEEYYAVGPGAARYVAGRRETNHRSTTTYLKRVLAGASPTAESETLSAEERARELLVFALRRIEGVEQEWFFRKSGFTVERLVGRQLEQLVGQGLLEVDARRVRLTREGLLVSDSIWPGFLRG